MSLTKPQILDFIKKGHLSDDKIAEYLENGTITNEELRNEARLAPDRMDKILRVVHLYRIKKGTYDKKKVLELVQSDQVDTATLKNMLTQAEFEYYFPPQMKIFNIAEDWTNVPALKPDRIDVFVLGVATSGKSCFMAGLIYYADRIGRLKIGIGNTTGYVYARQLIDAVRRGVLPPATPREAIQYMACDFKGDKSEIHPFSFVEMSGENFERAFGKKADKIPPKFNEYLFDSKNQKIFFLCIDYWETKEATSDRPSQQAQFDYILQLVEEHGVLNTTEAICIIVTKWDTYGGPDPVKGISDFLNSEYQGLISLCKDYETQYKKLAFIVFPFSLGDFSKAGTYTYNSEDSENIFNWLCDFTSYKNA